jgi:hypothetical protein
MKEKEDEIYNRKNNVGQQSVEHLLIRILHQTTGAR